MGVEMAKTRDKRAGRSSNRSIQSCLILTTLVLRHGDCQDDNVYEANFITSLDSNGNENTFGSLVLRDKICKFGRNGNGSRVSVCQPIELEELEPLEEETDDSTRKLYDRTSPVVSSLNMRGSLLSAQQQRELIYDDSGSNLDVMVVWTKQAECAESGLSSGCTLTETTHANMKGLVDLAVYETNVAFELSGIYTEIRLVHAYRHPDYIEKTDGLLRFTVGLSDLKGTTDPHMNDVHAKRSLYGADIVSMIVSKSPYSRKDIFSP